MGLHCRPIARVRLDLGLRVLPHFPGQRPPDIVGFPELASAVASNVTFVGTCIDLPGTYALPALPA